MPTQQRPTARPVTATAIVVRRFRLAIIDETGRPVIGICEVPEHLVQKTADFLEGVVPAIQGLASVQGHVSALFAQISGTFGGAGSSSAPKARRRRR